MKLRSTGMVPLLAFLFAASFFAPRRMNAQAPPGPIAPVPSAERTPVRPSQPAAKPKPPLPPRTTLAGPWKLNQDESDDPRQKVRSEEGGSRGGNTTSGGNPGGSYPGGGYPGGGYPGGGYPGGGYPGGNPYPRQGGGGPSGGRRSAGNDLEDNPKLQPLLHPSDSLSVALKDPEIDVIDDRLNMLILYTDGRQLPKATNNNREEVAAHWNGTRLESDEKSPLGGKMSRTFELSPNGRKIYETLNIDNGRSKSPLVIRYVYDAASSDLPPGQESDPNRPVLKRNSNDSDSSQQ